MPELLSDYARQAGEAFVAAGLEPDPVKAARLRARGCELVDMIRQREAELEQSPKAAE